jgi:hypothetical protein
MNKLFFLAPLALLAGCGENTAKLESRHFSNDSASVSITYSASIVMDNAHWVSDLEKQRQDTESDFTKMGFTKTSKVQQRPLMCSVEVERISPGIRSYVTCKKRQGMRIIQFIDNKFMSTMLSFIFPDDFKKLVPEG